MELDPSFMTELRVLFLNGATPAALVRNVTAHYPDDPMPLLVAEEYFSQAFQIGVLFHEPIDSGFLNVHLLRDMVGRCPLWRESVAHLVPVGSAWCDGLQVSTDDLSMHEAIRPECHPALADSWDGLPPKVRTFVHRILAAAQGEHERAEVFARLAGKLQERIGEPEVAEVRS